MNKIYRLNEQFFDNITNDSAYVLGWIASDGCIYINKKYSSYRLQFEIKDKEILELINELLDSNKQISYLKDRDLYSLHLSSKYMIDRLLQLGITPRKSKIIEMPLMNDECKKHFIRGVFDGDGSVSIFQNGKLRRIRCYICSANKKFLEQIGNFLKDEIYIIPKIYKEDKIGYASVYKLMYSGKECLAFANYIYQDCNNNYLSRKYNIFKQAIDENIATGFAKCRVCGKTIVKTSNKILYCPDCKKQIIANRDKARKHKKTLKAQGIVQTIKCIECGDIVIRKSNQQKYCDTCRRIVRQRKLQEYRNK